MIARRDDQTNGKADAPAVETPELPELPEEVTDNLMKAEAKLRLYFETGIDIRALDPRIAKLEDELAHLKAHQATLGRTQHKHLTGAKICHRMALLWCGENQWQPKPLPFEEMATAVEKQFGHNELVASGVADTQAAPAAGVDPLTDPAHQVA